jgi:RimJ/RimL family protein N-acetyltransferase
MTMRTARRSRHEGFRIVREPVRAARGRDVELVDGRAVHLRAVRPDDEPAVLAFLAGLGNETLMLRYFTAAPDLRMAARGACRIDERRDYGVLAIADGAVVGHGCLVRTSRDRAEVGFVVAEAYQGSGLGKALFDEVLAAAAQLSVKVLTALVRAGNRRMLAVFRSRGLPVTVRSSGSEVRVAIRLAPPVHPRGRQRSPHRHRLALDRTYPRRR